MKTLIPQSLVLHTLIAELKLTLSKMVLNNCDYPFTSRSQVFDKNVAQDLRSLQVL